MYQVKLVAPNRINEIFHKIILAINVDEYVLTGSYADHFNFNNFNVSYDVKIDDIDIYVLNMEALRVIETIAGIKSTLVDNYVVKLKSKNNYEIKQYFISLPDDQHIDIFLSDDGKMIENYTPYKHEYKKHEITCANKEHRVDTLKLGVRNFLSEEKYKQFKHKVPKYLKKIMLYEGI